MRQLLVITLLIMACCASPIRAEGLGQARVEAIVDLYKWDVESTPKGWLLFLDVFHGDKHADMKDLNNYLTITSAIDRGPKLSAFISFQVSNKSERKHGIKGVFAYSMKTASGFRIKIDDTSQFFLPFERCADSCVARTIHGKAKGTSAVELDLLQQFLSHDHLFISYRVGKEERRVGVPLFDFKSKYSAL
ncbi:MAG: hypothetical protein RW306_10050 [Geobacteraceae bacterium]|nr:hypothetical protein [Geobacteraceae bacterium]